MRSLKSDAATLAEERRNGMRKRSRPGAVAEKAFIEWAANRDYAPSKRGWPDFMMTQGEDLIAVEVKQHRYVPLSVDQQRVIQALLAHGIRCYVWSPDRPTLTPITPCDQLEALRLSYELHPRAILA